MRKIGYLNTEVFSRHFQVEVGNIEYKLKLVGTSDSRLEHLTTQMKWRLKVETMMSSFCFLTIT